MYVEQTVRDIRYILSEKPLTITLTNLKEKRFNLNGYEVKVTILGESHKIEISKEDFYLVEVVACIGNVAEKLPIENSNVNLNYNFKSLIHELKADNINDLDNLNNIEFNNIENISLSFEMKETFKFEAVTIVSINTLVNEKGFLFRTLHTYPNENKALLTESIIKFEE